MVSIICSCIDLHHRYFARMRYETGFNQVSTDSAALEAMVELRISVKNVSWEIFGTPESTGGVSGPTDYLTLIAEITPTDQASFEAQPKTGTIWIAPESGRPWLTERFRTLLASNRNRSLNLSNVFNCRKFQAKVKQNGRPADGFVCIDSGKLLVYLTLADYSLANRGTD